MKRIAPAFVLAVLTGCEVYSFDGVWLGACTTSDAGARVESQVLEAEDGTKQAVLAVNRPDRVGETLSLTCAQVEVDGRDVTVSGCQGSWDGTGSPNDLSLVGRMDRNDLTHVLAGSCSVDGIDGALELWQLP